MTDAEVETFLTDGVVRIDGAFSPEVAAAARSILWRDVGGDPDEPRTWPRPVVRLGHYGQEPFARAARSFQSAFIGKAYSPRRHGDTEAPSARRAGPQMT